MRRAALRQCASTVPVNGGPIAANILVSCHALFRLSALYQFERGVAYNNGILTTGRAADQWT
jgi:hypothetical protein